MFSFFYLALVCTFSVFLGLKIKDKRFSLITLCLPGVGFLINSFLNQNYEMFILLLGFITSLVLSNNKLSINKIAKHSLYPFWIFFLAVRQDIAIFVGFIAFHYFLSDSKGKLKYQDLFKMVCLVVIFFFFEQDRLSGIQVLVLGLTLMGFLRFQSNNVHENYLNLVLIPFIVFITMFQDLIIYPKPLIWIGISLNSLWMLFDIHQKPFQPSAIFPGILVNLIFLVIGTGALIESGLWLSVLFIFFFMGELFHSKEITQFSFFCLLIFVCLGSFYLLLNSQDSLISPVILMGSVIVPPILSIMWARRWTENG